MLTAVGSVFGSVLLVSGNDEFLRERDVSRAMRAVRESEPEAEVTEALPADVTGGFESLTSASLFCPKSAFVLRDIQDLDDRAQSELLAYVAAPSDDVAAVLVHPGGQKGKRLLERLRASGGVSERKVTAPKYESDYVSWVREEMGRRIEENAAAYLVRAIGQDLRGLAGAADQLASVLPADHKVVLEDVRRYFGGRAEIKGWDIADATIDGDIPSALEQLRWAINNNAAAPGITGAFASGLRSLMRMHAAPAGMRDGELAGYVGAPPFKVKALRRTLQGWDEEGLRRALDIVASADLDVKGASADASYALERMVLNVARCRRA